MNGRRGFLGRLAAWLAALWAACKNDRSGPLRPKARAHHKPDHAKGGLQQEDEEDTGKWDDWNRRRYERDLATHGAGIYAYALEPDGKYGDLTYGYPDQVGGRGAMALPANATYAVHVPANTYPKAA